jgi:hypothetical protein
MTITMKTKLITAIMIFAAGIFSCDDEETIQDPIYEFISFGGDAEVSLGEATNNDAGYPLVVQLWAFEPYTQDITVNLGIGAINAKKDEDFTVTPSDVVKIKAGKLTSDTIWVKTINNDAANELERTFEIGIQSTSLPDANIGLGIDEPRKGSIKFKIQDDECSGNPICIYNTDLTNTINWGGDDVPKPATGVTDKLNNTVTVSGDLIDYGPFSGATLTLTLTPDSPGAATGTATFGEQETGSDSDGYAYKFVEINTGSYNADTGKISIEYDIYYWDGDWIKWYTVTNDFSVP